MFRKKLNDYCDVEILFFKQIQSKFDVAKKNRVLTIFLKFIHEIIIRIGF